MELDKITKTLTSLLDISKGKNIILGGDFNLTPDSDGFEEVCNLLHCYAIHLKSDPSIPTFEKNGRKATLDYIFASQSVKVMNVNVVNNLNSDQYTLSIKLKIKRGICQSNNLLPELMHKINIK